MIKKRMPRCSAVRCGAVSSQPQPFKKMQHTANHQARASHLAHPMSGTLVAARHAALGAIAAAPLLALKCGDRVQRAVLQKGSKWGSSMKEDKGKGGGRRERQCQCMMLIVVESMQVRGCGGYQRFVQLQC